MATLYFMQYGAIEEPRESHSAAWEEKPSPFLVLTTMTPYKSVSMVKP